MVQEGIVAGGFMDVALGKPQAYLCVLAHNYDEPMYVKSVEALCAKNKNQPKVDDKKWEMVGCSCVMVKDYL